MGNEGSDGEEWDADFLDQLVQAEELALSVVTQPFPPLQSLPPLPLLQPQPPLKDVSYSPPRELSQRLPDTLAKVSFQSQDNSLDFRNSTLAAHSTIQGFHNTEELEIDRLKRELGRVSKQLTSLEQECLELRKQRNKKGEQLESVRSGTPLENAKNSNLDCSVTSQDALNRQADSSPDVVGILPLKNVGVQTEKICESNCKSELFSSLYSNKLLDIWDFRGGQKFSRSFVSELFLTCHADFCLLFGCSNMNMPDQTNGVSCSVESHIYSRNNLQPYNVAEAAKLSRLYSMLRKISNEMVQLKDLLEPLTDLFQCENVPIVYSSLRILHVVLDYLFSVENKYGSRNNIVVEVPISEDTAEETHKPDCFDARHAFWKQSKEAIEQGDILNRQRRFDLEIPLMKERLRHYSTVSTSIDWVSLFELVCQIVLRNNDKHVGLEAVSVMNKILTRTNAYVDRAKFSGELVFQCVSKLLRKESGLCLQQLAVHLLYLLLNCPKIMAKLCCCSKEERGIIDGADTDAKSKSSFEGYISIFEGLADCVACGGESLEEMKVRRNTIILLAFLASSGKFGFEVILNYRLPKGSCFLETIMQSLKFDVDLEAAESTHLVFKERTLLIREALIFLNRLVSHPQYSSPVLKSLTNRRKIAGLTVDVANRLSRKTKFLWMEDSLTRQIRETEVVDLARLFRKRVFTFLGDSVS